MLELEGLRVPYFSDVPDWSRDALKPHGGTNIVPDTKSEHASNIAEPEHPSEIATGSKDV